MCRNLSRETRLTGVTSKNPGASRKDCLPNRYCVNVYFSLTSMLTADLSPLDGFRYWKDSIVYLIRRFILKYIMGKYRLNWTCTLRLSRVCRTCGYYIEWNQCSSFELSWAKNIKVKMKFIYVLIHTNVINRTKLTRIYNLFFEGKFHWQSLVWKYDWR